MLVLALVAVVVSLGVRWNLKKSEAGSNHGRWVPEVTLRVVDRPENLDDLVVEAVFRSPKPSRLPLRQGLPIAYLSIYSRQNSTVFDFAPSAFCPNGRVPSGLDPTNLADETIETTEYSWTLYGSELSSVTSFGREQIDQIIGEELVLQINVPLKTETSYTPVSGETVLPVIK